MADAVGFIGLGIMGSLQAASLRRAGFELTVHNRTRERAEAWAQEHGAHVAATPREVGERASVVITMVVDGAQVKEVLLGEEGAAAGARPGTLFIDMSTIAPGTARELAATLDERGHAFVDAPVTGSSPKAKAGTLTIMCGGAQADVDRAMPLFEAMGEKIVHAGEASCSAARRASTSRRCSRSWRAARRTRPCAR
jgi:3-hydroxyisobutyrate dehydrogenase-like beta-hydroxyacid dehydrogenase